MSIICIDLSIIDLSIITHKCYLLDCNLGDYLVFQNTGRKADDLQVHSRVLVRCRMKIDADMNPLYRRLYSVNRWKEALGIARKCAVTEASSKFE